VTDDEKIKTVTDKLHGHVHVGMRARYTGGVQYKDCTGTVTSMTDKRSVVSFCFDGELRSVSVFTWYLEPL
jgi:hypothetical protein